jgi:thiamine pyrophosphokinase
MGQAPLVILLGGPLHISAQLQQEVHGLRCIAADGGMRHAQGLGLVPELWIGDFDSSTLQLQAQYPQVTRQVFPTAKDQTDGELAVQAALERGAGRLWLLGALGNETDKTLQHLLMAVRLAQQGVQLRLSNGLEEAWPLIPGHCIVPADPGSTLSVMGFVALGGLSLEGVRWPLKNQDIPLGSSLTLSNQTTGPVQINLQAGYGVVFLKIG